MADDADRAQAQIEADLERDLQRALAAARGAAPVQRTHCPDCGVKLSEQRRPYGRCVACQADCERWQRARLVGV
jgi:predicted amidophosphoribosyltransferase